MILTIVIGYTYALWTVRKEQTGMNTVDSGCLNITFTEADDINLENSYPMTDQEGLLTKPYTFTIENTCDLFANYQINLETFDAPTGKTRMPDSYMKVNLKQAKANKFSDTLKEDNKVETTITGATDAYKLTTGVLKGKATKAYNLRLWMDESITQYDEGAVNSYFNSKISVVFVAAVDPFAESGTLQSVYSSYSQKLWAFRKNITEVEFQNKMEPVAGAIESWDVSATNDGSVMAYMINQGTDTEPEYKVYIQGKGGVKANPNSSYLFYKFEKLNEIKGFEYFDTSNAINMSYMFRSCSKLEELDLSSWDTSNVTNMYQMFQSCGNLENLDVSNFDTSNVTNMTCLFWNCSKLKKLDLSSFDTSKITSMQSMFSCCYRLESLNVSSFDTSNVVSMSQTFFYCYNLKILDISNFNTSKVTDMHGLFDGCILFKTLNTSNFDTSNVTDMSSMFSGCSILEELDLSNFDTSNVTNMTAMFYGCKKLNKLNISNFDTSNVTSLTNMFHSCTSFITFDLSNFDTSNVTNMSGMFDGCSNLEYLDLSTFDTSEVTSMSWMFANCEKLKSLNISNFDTSNVTDMSSMFSGCSNLEYLDLSTFDTSEVTSMSWMFANCEKLKSLNISNFDTLKVTNMTCMFYQARSIIADLAILNPSTDYKDIFLSGGIGNLNAQLKLNYSSETEELVDEIISTKPTSAKVIKGEMLDAATAQLHSISAPSSVTLNKTNAYKNNLITLDSVESNKVIKSFKINGTLVEGNSFRMINENVAITDVTIVDADIIESEHNPYANNINNVVYYENTFDGATSITVILTYQTESPYCDWVYLYTSPTEIYQDKKYGGTILKTETITIDGNYLKIVFRTDSSGKDYYGFKAAIIPNYD